MNFSPGVLSLYCIRRWFITCTFEWVNCSTVSRQPTTSHNDVQASRASLTNLNYAKRVPTTSAERRPWKPALAARRQRQPALPLNLPTRYVMCRQRDKRAAEWHHFLRTQRKATHLKWPKPESLQQMATWSHFKKRKSSYFSYNADVAVSYYHSSVV